MKFDPPLTRGILVKRYKRFLVDVALEDGSVITAHCPNPGAMMGITTPGSPVWLSYSTNPKRKLAYTWQMVESEGILMGMNTMNPNNLVEEALRLKHIEPLKQYGEWRREVKYGVNSRIDFCFERCLLEIKNVHLIREKGVAEFPDCVTARGSKHLQELALMAKQGWRCIVLYVVQRKDCKAFKVASDLDPTYGKSAQLAKEAGVESLAYNCLVSPFEITIHESLEVFA